MLPDTPLSSRRRDSIADRVARLNHRYRHHAAGDIIRHAVADPLLGRVAVVSSFGAESVVLLHLVALHAPEIPVLFVDTGMLFEETLAYQRDVAERLGLRDVHIIRAERARVAAHDPDGLLHQRDPDACCRVRKVEPLERALVDFDAWITGRKRFQAPTRAALEPFEAGADGRVRINPLHGWRRADVLAYIDNNNLPRHPLVARGYPSIGCRPCTSPVAPGEPPRAGRWRGRDKLECGIHFIGGRPARTAPDLRPAPATTPAGAPPQAPRAGDDGGEGSVLVTDSGFTADDFAPGFLPLEEWRAQAARGSGLELSPDADPTAVPLAGVPAICITFPDLADGRGFTLARRLRLLGFTGRLRARGPLVAEQYQIARRAGFDEVEIPAALALRQPEELWLSRRPLGRPDYQARLRQFV